MTSIRIARTSTGKEISINLSSPDNFIDHLLTFSDRELFDALIALEYRQKNYTTHLKLGDLLPSYIFWIKSTLDPRTIHFFLTELGIRSNVDKTQYGSKPFNF